MGKAPNVRTRQTAKAISTNSVVQTGAKTQFGGLKPGLISPAYQDARFG